MGAKSGFLIFSISRAAHRLVDGALEPLGMDSRHMRSLAVLVLGGPCTQRQLQDLLDIDKSSMVHVVDDLEEQGWAERRDTPGDRRAHTVHVTPGGRRQHAASIAVFERVHESVFGFFSGAEREQLNGLLRRVIQHQRLLRANPERPAARQRSGTRA